MGIVTALEQRAAAGALGPPRDPVIAAWFGGNVSATGVAVTADTAMRVTAVFRAVSILAQTYASLPLGVYIEQADGGKLLDKTHPNYRLLHDQPNDWQTSFEWREMMQGHLALRGNGYSEIVGAGGRGIAQLVPLHPDRVQPFRAPDGKVAYAYTPRDGGFRVILQHEMHHLRGFPAADGLRGMSVIEQCREAVGMALATEEHGARLFSNGARLGGVLKMAGHLKDDDARKKFLKSWKDAHAGVRNAHKTALLEDGMEWQSIGLNSVDAQFLETRKMQIAEISRMFGVPLHMLAELDRSTNNNIEHQGIEFVTHTIRPGAVRWEQAMKRDLFYGASKDTHCASFDLDDLMRGDSAARGALYSMLLQNGVVNRNEVRIRERMNPSSAPGMNDFTVQSNMALIQFLEALTKSTKPGAANGSQEP
jgi:HK97 family phage portal protein